MPFYNWLEKFFAWVNPYTDEKAVRESLAKPRQMRRGCEQRMIEHWLRLGMPKGNFMELIPWEVLAHDNVLTESEEGPFGGRF